MPSYDIDRDGLYDLALNHDTEQALTAILDGDDLERADLVTDAINTAITELLQEHGVDTLGEWLGDWSANDVVAAIVAVAGEAGEVERAISELGQQSDGGVSGKPRALTLRHELREGAEHNHGNEQGTLLTLTTETAEVVSRPYRLPAEHDDDGETYWRAFRAADCYLESWLRLHGVDPAVTGTFIGGWSVEFDRAAWRS